VGRTSHSQSRRASLLLLILVPIGCTSQTTETTEPSIHGDPLPGSFYLTSDPPLAPYPVTIRVETTGGTSGRSAHFDEGDVVFVQWSTLPLPHEKWIEVNGQNCEGTFEIRARIETDLLLSLTDDGCRVEVLGSHPEDGWAPMPRSRSPSGSN
jgi:hypothetical protein